MRQWFLALPEAELLSMLVSWSFPFLLILLQLFQIEELAFQRQFYMSRFFTLLRFFIPVLLDLYLPASSMKTSSAFFILQASP